MILKGSRPPIQKERIKKILVIRLMSLGDVILSTPVVTALREQFKDAQITMLVDQAYAEAVLGHPGLDRVFAIPRSRIRKLPLFKRINEELAWFSKIKNERFDMVLDLQGTPRTMWMVLFSGIPYRVGFAHRRRGFVYNYQVIADNRYAVEVNLDLARAVGVEPQDKRLKVNIPSEARSFADSFLKALGVAEDQALIAFHVGGGWPAKFWPPVYFEQLARLIRKNKLGRLVLLEGPQEKNLVPRLAASLEELPIIARNFSVEQTGALLQRCAALVSNDTGPMHLALALQVPTIGLFGQEIKELWFPAPEALADYTGYQQAVALQHLVWCSPCHLDECERMECLKAITPAEVFQQVQKMAHISQNQRV